jgi:glycosyltransferase involved in cell wall biosynthesis
MLPFLCCLCLSIGQRRAWNGGLLGFCMGARVWPGACFQSCMRIAQVAPLHESVPPKLYGGTERVVSYLTEELVRQGHDVTLFASGDSVTQAQLVPCCKQALRLAKTVDPLADHIRMIEMVRRQMDEFDVVHFHIDYLHFPSTSGHDVPHITTVHGRLDLPTLPPLYRTFPQVPLVSISNAQRAPLHWANWQATVYHGLPQNLHHVQEKPGTYLAFLGRISPEKGVDRAIEIARRTGIPLKIAAKVDAADREYYKSLIKPLIDDGPLVEYIGEIDDRQKCGFLGGARALLFPIDWPEPFGLAMIEAFACGTPVVALRRGSVPEVVDEGGTGFVVNNVEEAARAVQAIESFNRRRCRQIFERRWTAARMARDYVATYKAQMARAPLDVPRVTALAPIAEVSFAEGLDAVQELGAGD